MLFFYYSQKQQTPSKLSNTKIMSTEYIELLGTMIGLLQAASKTLETSVKQMESAQRLCATTDPEALETADTSTPEECTPEQDEEVWESASEDQESEPSKSKTHKRKKVRDPSRPKRGKSAYFLWCDDNRATVKAQLEGERDEDDDTKIRVTTMTKRLSEMWKAIGDDEKAPYNEEAEVQKAAYREAIEAYNAKNGNVKKVSTKNTFDPSQEDNVDLPEGWTGPFTGYLDKHPVDPETGKRVTRGFATFAEAFAMAEKIGSACGGITLSTNAKGIRKLTLRKPGGVILNPDCNKIRKEVSYLIN